MALADIQLPCPHCNNIFNIEHIKDGVSSSVNFNPSNNHYEFFIEAYFVHQLDGFGSVVINKQVIQHLPCLGYRDGAVFPLMSL